MIAVTSRRLVAVAAGLLLSCAALAQTAAPDAVPMSPMPGHGPGMMGRAPALANPGRTVWSAGVTTVASSSCVA